MSFAENRRAIIALIVAAGVASVALLIMLFTRGGEPEAAPVPRATPTTTAEPEDTTSTAAPGSYVAPRSDHTDPFAPINDEEQTGTTATTKKQKSTSRGSDSAKGSLADDGEDTDTPKADEGDSGNDAADDPEPATPKETDPPMEPKVASNNTPWLVLLSVTPDSVDVKINGQRQTLYQAVPDASGITYYSQLTEGCAWLSTGGTDRVTLCKGESINSAPGAE